MLVVTKAPCKTSYMDQSLNPNKLSIPSLIILLWEYLLYNLLGDYSQDFDDNGIKILHTDLTQKSLLRLPSFSNDRRASSFV